jgi:hypothetical protein
VSIDEFLNDILQPWDKLNSLLIQPIAVQPGLSAITQQSRSIAGFIRNLPEKFKVNQEEVLKSSIAHNLMRDLSDRTKHGDLHNPKRNSTLSVVSAFEYRESKKFRFIRNIITIEHASLGSHDFMETSSAAAKFWMAKMGFSVTWEGKPKEAPNEWKNSAQLKFDGNQCIRMKQTRLQFFKMNNSGNLIPFDPPKWLFEIF